MVGFRKLFLVLAVVGLVAGTASAQIQSCSASSTTPLVRAEGLTEKVGTITVTCAVSNVTTSQTGNFTLTLGTGTFTNSKTSTATPPAITATAQVFNPFAATTFAGVLTSATQIDFNNVTLPFVSGSTQLVVKIDNVRINATAAAAGTTIGATLSGSAVAPGQGQSLAILPSTALNVAQVANGLNFSANALTTLTQCSNPATTSATRTLTFKPGFAYAFRDMVAGDPNAEPVDGAAVSKGVYLVALFKGVPQNANLTVQNSFVNTSTTNVNAAVLVSPAPVGTATEFTKATVASDGTATVIWQVTKIDSSPTAVGALTAPFSFDVKITGSTSALIGLGTVQVRGNLGPISSSTAALPVADAANIVPRFADVNGASSNIIAVVPCATTLLFPYVTSEAPWVTGIAISNTSKDIKLASGNYLFGGSTTDTTGQSGACTLNYFSSNGAANPASQSTSQIAPGGQSVFLVSTGAGDSILTARDGFRGYIVAQCDFLGAHGFAFATSGAAGQGGFGYNALVLIRSGALAAAETLGQ